MLTPKPTTDLEVLMTDNDNNQIGYTQPLGRGDGYTASDPLKFQSKLEDELECIPEKQNDYIQFSLGQQAWASDGDFGDGAVPSCSVGGWDGGITFQGGYPVCIRVGECIMGWLTRRYRNAKWIVRSFVAGQGASLLTEPTKHEDHEVLLESGFGRRLWNYLIGINGCRIDCF